MQTTSKYTQHKVYITFRNTTSNSKLTFHEEVFFHLHSSIYTLQTYLFFHATVTVICVVKVSFSIVKYVSVKKRCEKCPLGLRIQSRILLQKINFVSEKHFILVSVFFCTRNKLRKHVNDG